MVAIVGKLQRGAHGSAGHEVVTKLANESSLCYSLKVASEKQAPPGGQMTCPMREVGSKL
jgi:hypothetical protein